jgi:gluconolactonase
LPKGSLKPKSDAFYNLISRHTKIKRVATGFIFTEGPVWIETEKCLLFSDIPDNKIWKLSIDKTLSIFREPSGNSNGLTLDRQERLIACEHSNRRVTRTEKDGSITVLADTYNNMKLNSPNDVVVKSDGSVYFTDPPYGIQEEQQEQPVQGVYRISPEGTEIKLVADTFERPNGLAFSPDEKKLYVDNSEKDRYIRIFDVNEHGTLSDGKTFCDMNIDIPGLPDGMKLDQAGNIYCTGPGGVWVIDTLGNHLGTIATPEPPANCAWGDEDYKSLYITATTSIYKIRVTIPGNKAGACNE